MTESVERAQSEEKSERSVPASEEPIPMGSLADLIEVAASPDRVSDRVMPTSPTSARLPTGLMFIETQQMGEEFDVLRQQEVMPSLTPMPAWSPQPDASAEPEANVSLVVPVASSPAAAVAAAPAADITMATIEGLVSQNQWGKVCALLGAPEHQGRLPVGMAFIYAVALNELRVPGGQVDQRAPDIEKIMRRCLGVMLGADTKGPLAQIIAKRLMRRSWRSTPAPPTRTSVLLIIAALMLGSFIGFLIGPGHDWFKNM